MFLISVNDDRDERAALFSENEKYRYLYTWRWGAGPRLLWVMLNPGTSPDSLIDPTLRRCRSFSEAARYGSFGVVNLRPLCTAKPSELLAADIPTFADVMNDGIVRSQVQASDAVVYAWGSHGSKYPNEVDRVLAAVNARGRRQFCLGRTRMGQPRHPLYIPNGQELIPWAA